jgi:23S rRNA maturation mini-RNase III
MGYLHLSGQTDRMKELMAEAIRRISDAEHGSAE